MKKTTQELKDDMQKNKMIIINNMSNIFYNYVIENYPSDRKGIFTKIAKQYEIPISIINNLKNNKQIFNPYVLDFVLNVLTDHKQNKDMLVKVIRNIFGTRVIERIKPILKKDLPKETQKYITKARVQQRKKIKREAKEKKAINAYEEIYKFYQRTTKKQ